MVCQNQSIDDSDAPLARDLRVLVRERLTAGDSDRQVIDFLVARYGEFVLLQAARSMPHTLLLWLAPFAALVARRDRIVRVAASPPSAMRRRGAATLSARRAAARSPTLLRAARAMMSPRLTAKSPRMARDLAFWNRLQDTEIID